MRIWITIVSFLEDSIRVIVLYKRLSVLLSVLPGHASRSRIGGTCCRSEICWYWLMSWGFPSNVYLRGRWRMFRPSWLST